MYKRVLSFLIILSVILPMAAFADDELKYDYFENFDNKILQDLGSDYVMSEGKGTITLDDMSEVNERIDNPGDNDNKALHLYYEDNGALYQQTPVLEIKMPETYKKGKLRVGMRVMFETMTQTCLSLRGNGQTLCNAYITSNSNRLSLNSSIQTDTILSAFHYTDVEWEVDLDNKKMDVYVDGSLAYESLSYHMAADCLDSFRVSSWSTSHLQDNIGTYVSAVWVKELKNESGITEEIKTDARYDAPVKVLKALKIISTVGNTEAAITRAEFCKLVVKALGLQESNEKIFTDTTEEQDLYVSAAYNAGIIQGTGSSGFSPNYPLTPDAAAAMMVRGLGYPSNIDCRSTAVSLKLFKNGFSNEVTVGEAYYMIFNLLDAQMYELNFEGTNATYELGRTVLEYVHKCRKNTGIINANAYTSLSDSNGVGQNQVQIDDEIYSVGRSDIGEYIGYKAVYYESIDEDNEIITYYLSPKNSVQTISDEDIEAVSADGNRITIKKNDGKKVSFDAYITTIYNGIFKAEKLTVSDIDVKTGKIVLVDNDGSGYNTAIVESYQNVILDKYDEENKVVYGTGNEKIALGENVVIYENGEITGSLPEGSALAVAAAVVNGIVEKTTIYVTDEKIEGKIQSRSADTVKINDIVYDISPDCKITSELVLNANARLMLDIRGRILGKTSSNAITNAELKGYLIKAKIVDDEDEEQLRFKILTAGGEIIDAYASEKMKVESDRNVKAHTAVIEELKETATTTGEVNQPIIYKLNSSGEISWIDNTHYEATDSMKRLGVWKDGYSFDGSEIVYNSETIFYFVPDLDITKDSKGYAAANYTALANNTYYELQPFSYDDFGYTEVMVSFSNMNGALSVNNPNLVVDDISEALNEDDESAMVIRGYHDGEYKELFVDTALSLSDIGITELTRGDMLRVQLKDDTITQWALDFDISTLDSFSGIKNVRGSYIFVLYGIMTKYENGKFSVSPISDSSKKYPFTVSGNTKAYHLYKGKLSAMNADDLARFTTSRNDKVKILMRSAIGEPRTVIVIEN